jgi:hypothetical protein
MSSPLPSGSELPRRQLVRLDCAECGKVAAVVLPEDSRTFALCTACAPGGSARRHATREQRLGAERAEAERKALEAEEQIEWEVRARERYGRGASVAEADAALEPYRARRGSR